MGARAHGMGYASSCLRDVWSLTNNVAGLADINQPTAGFSYHAVPSFKYFNRMGAVFATPVNAGTAGISMFRFGDDLYSEQIASAALANTFGLASLGIKLNYIQYKAYGMETRSGLTVSFGGIAALTPTLFAGAHIVNINQPVINEQTGERIPTRLITGFSYQPSDKLIISSEIEKDLGHTATLKSGLDYQVLKKIAFRTGFHLNPQSGFFGLGFKTSKVQLDYALQFNHPLGMSHQATVTYQFRQP